MSRKDEVLTGAVDVLATVGMRGLTYQAVDKAAGVPAGSASNYFRTRAALVRGVLAHLLDLDRRDWEDLLRELPYTPEQLAELLAQIAQRAVDAGHARTRARYVLFLEATVHPDLAELLAHDRATVVGWGARLLTRMGVTRPTHTCRRLLAYLDGAVLHQLTFPANDFEPASDFLAILQTHDAAGH